MVTNSRKNLFDFLNISCDKNVTMQKEQLLIVDDDIEFAEKLAKALIGLYNVAICHSVDEFHQKFAVGKFDLIIMDMRLEKEKEGLLLLKQVLNQDPMQAAIVMTAYADMESYADALESGAITYLDKNEFSAPLIARMVETILQQSNLQKRMIVLEQRLETIEPLEIIGASEKIVAVREQIRKAAEDGDVHVLITGAPGTGKKLAANNIHRISRRRSKGPFLCVSFRQTPQLSVLEQLFGKKSKEGHKTYIESKGYVDLAKGGILVIDDLNSLDRAVQTSLLEFLESGRFTRVGGERQIAADIQVVFVCSTSALSSNDEVFRENLVGRLGGIDIRIPSLNKRPKDIPLIARYILQNLYRHGRTQARSFRSSAMQSLKSLLWPGNVRELKISVEYASILADASNDREIGIEHLPMNTSPSQSDNQTPVDYQLHLVRSELALVEKVIEQFGITKKWEIAEKLRYPNRFTFSRRMQRNLNVYPQALSEFPRTTNLFAHKR